MPDLLTIGEVARRSGVTTSALRFYDAQGLIRAGRTESGHRLFPRDTLRRVAFIRVAQHLGISLEEIGEAIASLPEGRTPTERDWGKLARAWRQRLDDRIGMLERLRDNLDGCIGCGCLSLKRCAIFNPDDVVGERGPGPRNVLDPPSVSP
jgi:MerR family redox-sensitive transcriptional activator SoxR